MITRARLIALAASLLLAAYALSAAPAALAMRAPDQTDGGPLAPPPPEVVHDGTALWAFGLVAVVAACLTVAAILTIQALRHRRVAPTAHIKHA